MKRVKKITKVTFKYFIVPSIVLIFLVIFSAAATLYFFPKDKVISILSGRIEHALDRKVHISDIKYKIGGFSLRDIRIMDDKKNTDVFLSANEVSLRVSIRALLKGNIDISGIKIDGLNGTVSYENGTWNIESIINSISRNIQPDSSSTLDTKIAYISFENAKMNLISAPLEMKPLVGSYLISGTINSPGSQPLIVNDFNIVMPYNRGSIFSQQITISPLNDSFKIKGNIELNKCALSWLYSWGEVDFLPFSLVSGICTDTEISKNEIKGRFQGNSYLKNKRKLDANGEFSANISPVMVRIKNVKASVDSSTAEASYINALKGKVSLGIKSMNIKLNEIIPLFLDIPSNYISGNASGSFNYTGTDINSDIVIKNFNYGGEFKYIEIPEAKIVLKNGLLTPLTLNTKIIDQSGTISIASTNNVLKDIILNFTFPTLDLDKIPISDSKNSNINIRPLPFNIRGNLTVKKANYQSYAFSDISAIYNTTNTGISIPRYSLQYYESTAVGKATIDFTGINRGINIETSITGFKVQRIGEHYKDIESRFFGVAKGKAALIMDPFSSKPLIDTLHGKVNFTISNGKVVNTGIQNQLGAFLDPLKFKLRDLEFNWISGNIFINGQSLIMQSMVFNSPDIRLICDGSIQQSNILDSKMTLEFNNNFIQDIPNPALLTINKYKKGKWYTVNFTTKGKISDNNYNIDIKD